MRKWHGVNNGGSQRLKIIGETALALSGSGESAGGCASMAAGESLLCASNETISMNHCEENT
jgi:hypothetical protein